MPNAVSLLIPPFLFLDMPLLFFYPQGARQNFMPYPQTGIMRTRWPGPPGAQQRQSQYPSVAGGFVALHPQGRAQRGPARGQVRAQGQQGGNGRNFKYTPNVRNQPNQGGPKEGHLAASITTSVLASATPEERKQILGENLFSRIRSMEPANAPKITGMLLESLPFEELLALLESTEALTDKIEEALGVLKNHAQGLPDQGVVGEPVDS